MAVVGAGQDRAALVVVPPHRVDQGGTELGQAPPQQGRVTRGLGLSSRPAQAVDPGIDRAGRHHGPPSLQQGQGLSGRRHPRWGRGHPGAGRAAQRR